MKKVKIEYEYCKSNAFPFVAWIKAIPVCKSSRVSFEEAKAELLKHYEEYYTNRDEEINIPAPEEVEL